MGEVLVFGGILLLRRAWKMRQAAKRTKLA